MEAYAEGLNLLRHANAGAVDLEHDAETTPMSDPERYRYEIDVSKVAEVWRRGTVVRSWLLDLAAAALARGPGAGGFLGTRLGLRRGPLDGARRDRDRRAGAGPDGGAVRALQLARRGRRTPTACCRRCGRSSADTQSGSPNRRQESTAPPARRAAPDEPPSARRRARLLRRDRRPGVPPDLPGPAAHGTGRRPRRADRRRGARALEPREAARPRARQPRGQPRRTRPGGIRAPQLADALRGRHVRRPADVREPPRCARRLRAARALPRDPAGALRDRRRASRRGRPRGARTRRRREAVRARPRAPPRS